MILHKYWPGNQHTKSLHTPNAGYSECRGNPWQRFEGLGDMIPADFVQKFLTYVFKVTKTFADTDNVASAVTVAFTYLKEGVRIC
jgi:hypothetical protein